MQSVIRNELFTICVLYYQLGTLDSVLAWVSYVEYRAMSGHSTGFWGDATPKGQLSPYLFLITDN